MTKLHMQYIEYEDKKYSICDLIEASKDLEVKKVNILTLGLVNYSAPCDNNLKSFIEHAIKANKADIKHPIILCPTGFVLDGRHRIVKAQILGLQEIPAVQFTTMPEMGF